MFIRLPKIIMQCSTTQNEGCLKVAECSEDEITANVRKIVSRTYLRLSPNILNRVDKHKPKIQPCGY